MIYINLNVFSDSLLQNENTVKTHDKESDQKKTTKGKELGNYSDAVVPLLSLAFCFAGSDISFSVYKPDYRTTDWFLMGSSSTVIIMGAIYILFSTVWGPKFMKNREPYNLKGIIKLYNCLQVILSAWMFFEVYLSIIYYQYFGF